MGRGWSRGDVHEKEVRGRIRRCRLGGLARWRAHRLPVPVNRPTDGPTQPRAMRRLMWVGEKFQRAPVRAWSCG